MGASLPKGGPAGLFLGFVVYGTIILAVNQCFGKSNFLCIYPFLFFILVIQHTNIFKFYSGDGHLSPYSLALRPVIWILGRRRLEFCDGMELFLSYGYVTRNDSSPPFGPPCPNLFSPFLVGYCLFSLATTAFAIPYEITAIDVLLTFWTDKIPVGAVVVVCLVIYACAFPSPLPSLHLIAS
jgi:hypothetical protein